MILDAARTCGHVITIEENSVRGGFGAAVLELLAANDLVLPVRTLGVPDRIFEQASQSRLGDWPASDPKGIGRIRSRAASRQPVAEKEPSLAI